ncbi:MAG: J domain-containing protein [Candidatus Vogelbacteria bacterium]|nr:J domain-containing protein [Candidatus Vogelbacteria bacterium]
MGQIFNRLKRLVKINIRAVRENYLPDSDFLKRRWEAGNRLRENLGNKFEEGQECVKEAWDDLTTNVPYSLKVSYDVLEVPFGLPLKDVRDAWIKKIQKHHPDRYPEGEERENATKKAAILNEAFQKIENFFTKGKV